VSRIRPPLDKRGVEDGDVKGNIIQYDESLVVLSLVCDMYNLYGSRIVLELLPSAGRVASDLWYYFPSS